MTWVICSYHIRYAREVPNAAVSGEPASAAQPVLCLSLLGILQADVEDLRKQVAALQQEMHTMRHEMAQLRASVAQAQQRLNANTAGVCSV